MLSEDYQEDLYENKFFKTLINDYNTLYQTVQDQCLLICVPQSLVFSNKNTISREIIETHIFKASPLSPKVYECFTDVDKQIEITKNVIIKVKGFNTDMDKVKILFEETFYNSKYEPFRVLCIEKSLLESENGDDLLEFSEFDNSSILNGFKLYDINTLASCQDFLFSFAENEIVLKKIGTYIVEDFFNLCRVSKNAREVVKRMLSHIEMAIESLLCANIDFRSLQDKPSLLQQLEIIIETWVIGCVASGIQNYLMDTFKLVDEELYESILSHQALTMEQLNIRKEMMGDFSKAINEFSITFRKASTPLEKLFVLKSIVDEIKEQIEKVVVKLGTRPEDVEITSDDIISIAVYIIIQSKPKHLQSQLFYVQNFISTNLSKSKLGYNLTTFIVASEYIRTGKLLMNSRELKRSNSYYDVNMSRSYMNSLKRKSFHTMSGKHFFREISTGRSFGEVKKR